MTAKLALHMTLSTQSIVVDGMRSFWTTRKTETKRLTRKSNCLCGWVVRMSKIGRTRGWNVELITEHTQTQKVKTVHHCQRQSVSKLDARATTTTTTTSNRFPIVCSEWRCSGWQWRQRQAASAFWCGRFRVPRVHALVRQVFRSHNFSECVCICVCVSHATNCRWRLPTHTHTPPNAKLCAIMWCALYYRVCIVSSTIYRVCLKYYTYAWCESGQRPRLSSDPYAIIVIIIVIYKVVVVL